jgi:hypothetical protein
MAGIAVQFCRFDSLFSRLILYRTAGTVCHAMILLPDGNIIDAENDVIDGVPAGVQVRPGSYITKHGGYNICRFLIPCSQDVEDAFYAHARSCIGMPYDMRADEGIALNRDWSSSDKRMCSGLVTDCLTAPTPACIPWPLQKKALIWTPEELMLACNFLAAPVNITEKVPCQMFH